MYYEKDGSGKPPWGDECLWGGSGRDVLRLVLNYGITRLGWRRIWIPAYFCKDVTLAILATGIDIAVYPHGPEDGDNPTAKIDAFPDDVLLVVNFFGNSKRIIEYGVVRRKLAAIVEDHTHDPWSGWAYESKADWCLASLRKTLPLPDGGVLWSPRKHQLPASTRITRKRTNASLKKLAGMCLKALYLGGHRVEKDIFRQLLVSGERGIGSGCISGMSDLAKTMVSTFPTDRWREARRRNHRVMCDMLSDLPWLSVLGNDKNIDGCPFSTVLLFNSAERRNFVRGELIRSHIYPAILWPLEKPAVDGIPERYIELSRRILSIHCDMRYDEGDMVHVGRQIARLGNNKHIHGKL